MKLKRIAAAVLAAALSAALITGCQSTGGNQFPDPEKTITLIVPQGAGGGTDTQARQLVEAMKAVSGNNNIIVENVTGGLCWGSGWPPRDWSMISLMGAL